MQGCEDLKKDQFCWRESGDLWEHPLRNARILAEIKLPCKNSRILGTARNASYVPVNDLFYRKVNTRIFGLVDFTGKNARILASIHFTDNPSSLTGFLANWLDFCYTRFQKCFTGIHELTTFDEG
jgi:hypothetical protein